ncbi:hypothetical protein GTW37_23215, partial [Streptomyces sp. SID4931]|nr:hypothetical protein [Streptomyces sp. SID4931]
MGEASPGRRSGPVVGWWAWHPNIATNTAVDLDELLAFVRPRHRAVLLTTRADGRPQGSPLTCGVDDAGRIVMSTYPERAKTRNARRDERVSVIV